MTANKVEPEPDINAAPTSGCFSNHIFNSARKTNFSKTGRSRSLMKLWSPDSCAPYKIPGIDLEFCQREYAHALETANAGFNSKIDNFCLNVVGSTISPR